MSQEEFVRNCIYDWQQKKDDTVPLDFEAYARKHRHIYSLKYSIPIVIPFIPSNVKILICCNNTILPELPSSLESLTASRRTKLPKLLPESLRTLSCDIQTIQFPKHLRKLYLSSSSENINVISPLPEHLEFLTIRHANVRQLPPLPKTLTLLDVYYNQLECLPELPDSLEVLNVMNNCLHELPTLPPNVREIICDNNFLTKLPNIPSSVQFISYSANKFTSKPIIPDTVLEYYGGTEYGYKLYPDPPNDQNPIIYN